MRRFEEHFGEWIVRWRWFILGASVLVTLAAGAGLSRLSFNNDLRAFFSKDNPQLRALERLEDTFTKFDNIFYVVAPENGDVFTRENLAAVRDLTETAWQMPYSSRVDSITNFQHTYAQGDDLMVEPLVEDPEKLTSADLARIKGIATREPFILNRLISPSGHATGVNIIVLKPGKTHEEVTEIVRFARELRDRIENRYPGVKVYLTGGVMFDNGFGEASRDDLTTLVPAMFAVLVGILILTLQSFWGVLATLMVLLFSALNGMGISGWMGITLTPASANAPLIILTLAIADSIHILSTFFVEIRKGRNRKRAITTSLRLNLKAVFLTSLTTAIGFLTMNFSDAPPFRDLGNIVAIGITAAFIYSVTFLPALLAVLPFQVSEDKKLHGPACDGLARFVIRFRQPIIWCTPILVMTLAAAIPLNVLGDDWIKYFDTRYEIRVATDYLMENLTGVDMIEYALDSGKSGGINDPAYLSKVEEFADWYRKQPGVVHVNVMSDVIKRLNKNMHGDDPAFYRIPESRELAAQYLLLYEMSLPFGLDLNNRINVDKSSTRMLVLFSSLSTPEIREMEKKGEEWLDEHAGNSFSTIGTGLSVVWAHISERNIRSMMGASFGALVLISFILIFAFRSLKLGVISLIPNLAPAVMGFGIWGLTVSKVGLGLSVVISLTLGIVVDDTVHFLSNYREARRHQEMAPPEAVGFAFHTVGSAMWITTAALAGGFLVLLFSGYRMNSDMGLLTAITITLALALDFLYLPALLLSLDREPAVVDKPAGIRLRLQP